MIKNWIKQADWGVINASQTITYLVIEDDGRVTMAEALPQEVREIPFYIACHAVHDEAEARRRGYQIVITFKKP